MRIKKKLFNRDEKRKIRKVKALVIHWPGPPKRSDGYPLQDIDHLWDWMNRSSVNSYHYFVSKNTIYQTRDLKLRAIHCGHRTYRKKAKVFFGEKVCSNVDSPNNYTIGICALHDNNSGGYNTSTVDSLIDLCTYLCMQFGLNPVEALFRHSDITKEKRVPCPLGFFEDDEDPDDLWNSFKEWVKESISQQYEKLGIER